MEKLTTEIIINEKQIRHLMIPDFINEKTNLLTSHQIGHSGNQIIHIFNTWMLFAK